MRRRVGTPPAPPFLNHAGAPDQFESLASLIRGAPELMRALEAARSLSLAQTRIVSGAFYNAVWNLLTGRPAMRPASVRTSCLPRRIARC